MGVLMIIKIEVWQIYLLFIHIVSRLILRQYEVNSQRHKACSGLQDIQIHSLTLK